MVRREICQVTVRGTQVCGLQDPGPGEASAAYMMAIAEEVGDYEDTFFFRIKNFGHLAIFGCSKIYGFRDDDVLKSSRETQYFRSISCSIGV